MNATSPHSKHPNVNGTKMVWFRDQKLFKGGDGKRGDMATKWGNNNIISYNRKRREYLFGD